MKKEVIKFYVSYLNDYLTVSRMAEDYGITEEECMYLIDMGKKYHEDSIPKIVKLSTVQEIKQAVNEGKTVYDGNEAYTVIKDKKDQWLIKCSINGYCIGLHGMEGTPSENRLNGTDFYYINQ